MKLTARAPQAAAFTLKVKPAHHKLTVNIYKLFLTACHVVAKLGHIRILRPKRSRSLSQIKL
jgi:hypothetical protein